MGFKRPFDDEEFEELPFKHSRQLDCSNKLLHFADCYDAVQTTKIPGESEEVKDNTEVSNQAEKDLETSAPLSWVTSSSGDEDSGTGGASYSSISPDYFEFNFPQRTFTPFEDVYSSYLDRPPKRQVPLGPNHQATLPVWSGHLENKLEDAEYEHDAKLMGSCVIEMPDMELSPRNSDKAGGGRTNCNCLDEGSVRCVQQHLTEKREELKKTLGHENFVDLGFYDMGEEVVHRWSEEEQRVFHEVVYSNPASLGQNFWKHLSAVFPYRTTKELVSYYFNVFMLHRRALQNRSNLLNVDSDDDEWHGNRRTSHEVRVSEDDDSEIDSLVDPDDQVEIRQKSHENDDDSDDDDSDDDDFGGGDVGDKSGDAMGEDCGIDHVSDGSHVNSSDDSRFGIVTSKIGGSDGVARTFNVKDCACISLQQGHNMVDSSGPLGAVAALPMSSVKNDDNKSLHGELDCSSDVTRHVYLMESYDAKIWDSRYPSPTKGVDFLPTYNIIEEIFGKESWDEKTTNGGPPF